MKERRHSERVKCRFPTELVRGATTIRGTVVDISTGGLAVRAEGELQQGDPVEVRMNVPGRGTLVVEAIAWHVRRARLRESGECVYLFGMMLSKAPDLYFKLARAGRSTTMTVSRCAPALAAAPVESPPSVVAVTGPPMHPTPNGKPVECVLAPYRVRLKHRASPRTRVVSVEAASFAEARQIASKQLGGEWEVLETDSGRRG